MPSMRLTTSPVMPCSGESNGSAALVTIRAFRATHNSAFAWRSFPPAKRIRLARDRSWQTKTTAKISVGLLPYISIVSVWQQRRPVITDLAPSLHRLTIDTSSCRMVAVEQDGDPYRNTLGSSFTRFSPNDCVQAGIIKNHVSSAAPSNSATGKEFERSGHGMAV